MAWKNVLEREDNFHSDAYGEGGVSKRLGEAISTGVSFREGWASEQVFCPPKRTRSSRKKHMKIYTREGSNFWTRFRRDDCWILGFVKQDASTRQTCRGVRGVTERGGNGSENLSALLSTFMTILKQKSYCKKLWQYLKPSIKVRLDKSRAEEKKMDKQTPKRRASMIPGVEFWVLPHPGIFFEFVPEWASCKPAASWAFQDVYCKKLLPRNILCKHGNQHAKAECITMWSKLNRICQTHHHKNLTPSFEYQPPLESGIGSGKLGSSTFSWRPLHSEGFVLWNWPKTASRALKARHCSTQRTLHWLQTKSWLKRVKCEFFWQAKNQALWHAKLIRYTRAQKTHTCTHTYVYIYIHIYICAHTHAQPRTHFFLNALLACLSSLSPCAFFLLHPLKCWSPDAMTNCCRRTSAQLCLPGLQIVPAALEVPIIRRATEPYKNVAKPHVNTFGESNGATWRTILQRIEAVLQSFFRKHREENLWKP